MSHLGFDPVQQPLVENDLADELERPLSAPPPPGFVNSEDRNKLANELLHEEMEASNSFSNIAAMLGQGLAESLEESNELSYHRMARHAANRLMGNNNDPVLPQPKNRTNIAYARKSTPNNHHNNFGFPGSLSTPPRATTPIQMYPGQWDARRNATTSNDIGMNVVEPEEFDVEKFASDPTVGSDSNGSRRELERGIKNLWSPEAREFRPQGGPHSTTSSLSEPNDSKSSSDPHLDLEPYIWDGRVASRTLAIIHVSWLHDKDVRSACETYGVLESFRADFSSRGVYFVSYYDIRSAQYASVELQSILQRLSVMQRSSEEVIVKYCLSLSASSQFDESQMVVCNLPPEVSEYHLKSMLSSYGALRSVVKQDNGNYLIEFQNLQDTKQAMLEIDSSQPWGPLVGVEVNLRDQFERQRGRELLALIGRWRHGMTRRNPAGQSDFGRAPPQRNEFPPFQEPPQRQFVLGPDGRYTEVFVQNPGNNFQSYNSMDKRSFQKPQQILQGPNGQIYVATQVAQPRSGHTSYTTMNNSASSASFSGQAQQSNPYFSYVSSDATSVSGRSHNSHHSHRSGHSSHGTEDRDNRHLMLDLEHVESGEDTRTSLMVRNIPNKYTQQMLLSEFEELGHGPGVIDFFYLPIDFKNRCNRGYAFINFVSYNDILAFHRRYFGKHWRTFNSDKICDITYARIQGKEAMLKRFENSALMEKDDEYKPLVFASDGPDKGKRLPFPDPNRAGGGQYHC